MAEKRIRFFFILTAGILHVFLLLYIVVPGSPKVIIREESRTLVINLTDIREFIPPPVYQELLPDIEPEIIEAVAEQEAMHLTEQVAEQIIEIEELPNETFFSEIAAPVYESYEVQEEVVEYLPMSSVTILPRLPEDQIRRAIVYPPIAQRTRTEGIVYLELLIDLNGNIQNIRIIQENPENRGFGEAAVNALRGITAIPGEADGQRVGVRLSYPIRFTLR